MVCIILKHLLRSGPQSLLQESLRCADITGHNSWCPGDDQSLSKNVNSATGSNTKPIVSSYSLCQSWQSQVLGLLKEVIHLCMERMPKPTVQKISFFTSSRSQVLIVTYYIVSYNQLPGLMGSLGNNESERHSGLSWVDFKTVQSNWLAEDSILLGEINTGTGDH